MRNGEAVERKIFKKKLTSFRRSFLPSFAYRSLALNLSLEEFLKLFEAKHEMKHPHQKKMCSHNFFLYG